MDKRILVFPGGVIIGLFMLGVSLSVGFPTWLDGNLSINCRQALEINRSTINGSNDIFNFPIVVNGINNTYVDHIPLQDLIDQGYLDNNCNCIWFVNNISNDSIELEWHFANKISDNYGCNTNNAEIWLLAPEIPDIAYMYYDNNCGASSDNQNLTGPFFDYNLNLHFAEETGPNTYGSSKYMNNGTLFGNTIFDISGKSGANVNFDGGGDYIKVNDDDELDGFQNFTIEFWYNPEASQNDYTFYISKGDWNTPEHRSYLIRRRYQTSNYYQVAITWLDGTNSFWNSDITSETSGDYHHLVLTYNNSHVQFYQNSNRIGYWAVAGKTVNASILDLYIGGYTFYSGQDFNGRIDEVKIKSEYSNPVEIKRAYEIGLSNLQAQQCNIYYPLFVPVYTAFAGKTEKEYLVRVNCEWESDLICTMGFMAGYNQTNGDLLCCITIGAE